jgi:hypothetical protein
MLEQSRWVHQAKGADSSQHISEITPWMNRTGIDAHLKGLDWEKLHPRYWLPREQEEQLLYLICQNTRRDWRMRWIPLDKT